MREMKFRRLHSETNDPIAIFTNINEKRRVTSWLDATWEMK